MGERAIRFNIIRSYDLRISSDQRGNPGQHNNLAYFSVYLQDPPGENLTVLNDSRPEVRFARKVLAAIMQGGETYMALFAGHPMSPEQTETAGAEYEMMRKAISANPDLSRSPHEAEQHSEVRYPCPEHHSIRHSDQRMNTAKPLRAVEPSPMR